MSKSKATTGRQFTMVTLKNARHGTSVTLRVPLNGLISDAQYARLRRRLCRFRPCNCGIVCGPQTHKLVAHVKAPPLTHLSGTYVIRANSLPAVTPPKPAPSTKVPFPRALSANPSHVPRRRHGPCRA